VRVLSRDPGAPGQPSVVPSPTVFDLTGHPPRSVKDWVAEHISLFTTPDA
jgi:hypothetical protein